jgi:hypothetical protein
MDIQPEENNTPKNNAASHDKDFKELPIKDFSYVNTNTKPPNRSKHRLLIIILVVVIAIVVGGLFILKNRKVKPETTQGTKTAVTHQTASNTVVTPSAPLKTYSSTPFNLEVKYPESWVVSQNGATSLNISSPVTQLKNAKGQSVEGEILVSVLPTGQIPAAFGTGDGAAVLSSQLVSYASPTVNQRAQTYLSFVQYATTTTLGGLDGIYITGNYGYQKDQTIPRTDLTGLSPLVAVTFEQCADTSCTTPVALTIQSSVWQDSSFSAPILNILKSFSFN